MRPREELDERFADWVDGRLSAAARQALEAELAADPELAAAAERYRAFVFSLRAPVAVSRLPQEFTTKVLDALPDRDPVSPRGGGRFRILPYLASGLAAALIVSLLLVIDGMQNRPPSVEQSARDSTASATPKSEVIARDSDLPELAKAAPPAGEHTGGFEDATQLGEPQASRKSILSGAGGREEKSLGPTSGGAPAAGPGASPRPDGRRSVESLEKDAPKFRGAPRDVGGGGGGLPGTRGTPAPQRRADDPSTLEGAKSKRAGDLTAFIQEKLGVDKAGERGVPSVEDAEEASEEKRLDAARSSKGRDVVEDRAAKAELGNVLLTLRLDPVTQPLPWMQVAKERKEVDSRATLGFTRNTPPEAGSPAAVAGTTGTAAPVDGLSWLSSQIEMQMWNGNRLPPEVHFLTWTPAVPSTDPVAGLQEAFSEARKLADAAPNAGTPGERVLRVHGDPDQVSSVVRRLNEIARETKGSLDVGRQYGLPHPTPGAPAGTGVFSVTAEPSAPESRPKNDRFFLGALGGTRKNEEAQPASKPGRAQSRRDDLTTIWIRLLVGR